MSFIPHTLRPVHQLVPRSNLSSTRGLFSRNVVWPAHCRTSSVSSGARNDVRTRSFSSTSSRHIGVPNVDLARGSSLVISTSGKEPSRL